MSAEVIELNTNVQHTPLEYVYITIPAEYVCVYHRILAMLADFGVEMLEDCKASCKDRNSGVIECYNMFNAAVAARKLGKDSLAETLIKYIKSKINQIYKDKDNSTSFVFPVDENGQLKAFVSCGERPKFWINPDDGELYKHKFHNGFDEHFRLGPEDDAEEGQQPVPIENAIISSGIPQERALVVTLIPSYELIGGGFRPCADVKVYYLGKEIDINNVDIQYYFDDIAVVRFNDVTTLTSGMHTFQCVVNYKGITAIDIKDLDYEVTVR